MTKIAIIGAGASGLFCAIQASYLGAEVHVFERNAKPGLKILVSGGGRCNFTNLNANATNYIGDNPHFCKSALSRFSAADFLAWYESLGLSYCDKKPGQLFCSNGAKSLLDAMICHAIEMGISLHVDCQITDVEYENSRFKLVGVEQNSFDKLVIACGGLSWPKLGASGFGYQLAKKFGHNITTTLPGLVPLLWDEPQKRLGELSGLSLPVSVKSLRQSFEDDLLFTHNGISGPTILQISNYWERGESLEINFLPHLDIQNEIDKFKKNRPDAHMSTFLEMFLPKRFVRHFLPESWPDKVRSYSDQNIQLLKQHFCHWNFTPLDQAGFGKAEVTLGGVDTQHVSSKTFESQHQKGLYFIGEVLDVTGQLGGYNFQWAWSSAWAAAQDITKDE